MKLILSLLLLSFFASGDEPAPTFKWSIKPKQYALGLIKPDKVSTLPPSEQFLAGDDLYPAELDYRKKLELSPVKDQGNCGSCVFVAVTSTFEDTMRMRGVTVPELAPQFLMDCVAKNACNGSWFETVASGLVKKTGQAKEADYPYKAINQSCKGTPQLYGKIQSQRIIDNSAKSIISALNKKYAVATTIGAGGYMMDYDSGIMNRCQSIGTNHEMSIVGYHCGTAIENGSCKFDASNNLPTNSGAYWIIRNSWGTNYGEEGYLRISMRNTSGGRCNNVTEEVGVLETGIDPEPPCEPKPKADAGPEKSVLLEVSK